MNIFYVMDEYTDVADAAGANNIREAMMDSFRNPHKSRPEGEMLLGEMCRECVHTVKILTLEV